MCLHYVKTKLFPKQLPGEALRALSDRKEEWALHTQEPLLRMGTLSSTSSELSRAQGEAGWPQSSSHPDVQPGFCCRDSWSSSQGSRWAALTWEQALQGPDALCLVSSPALGSRCGLGVGAGHSSRCVQSEQEWLQRSTAAPGPLGLGTLGAGPRGLPIHALSSTLTQTMGPRAKRDSGFTKTDSGTTVPKDLCFIT